MTQSANVELEVKLTLDPETVEHAHAVLSGQANDAVADSVALRNIYFDTPDFALNRQRMALRIRQKGSRFIQTLKTQGEFVDGGHRRMEWEWPVETAELDLSLLAQTPVADHTALHQLRPAFETNFERQVLMIREPGPKGESLVEVAIDQGRILSGDRFSALCEIEFELKSGDPTVLRKQAVRLAESVPVFLNVISKAEQGYHLAGVPSPKLDAARAAEAGAMDVYGFFRCLSACWLRQLRFPAGDAGFGRIRHAAASTGVLAEFDELARLLSSDQPVNPTMGNGLLGRVQLALAGFSPA